jgi:hypothetical protein
MARRRKKKSLPARIGEEPTVERRRQLGGTVREVLDRDAGGKATILRHKDLMECMLDAYFLSKHISKQELEAGMKYRKAWLRARHGIKVSDPSSLHVPVSYEDSLNLVFESERILKQADGVLSTAQRNAVIKVAGEDKRAGGTDMIETLGRGLERLARRWGIR